MSEEAVYFRWETWFGEHAQGASMEKRRSNSDVVTFGPQEIT